MKRRITDINPLSVMGFRALLLSLCALLMIAMHGCVTAPQLPVQYATMKLIENGTADSDEVILQVERVRELITEGVTLADLGSRVRDVINYSRLPPSDRLLIDAILGDISHRLDIGFSVPISESHKDAILEALDWIDQAAALYQ